MKSKKSNSHNVCKHKINLGACDLCGIWEMNGQTLEGLSIKEWDELSAWCYGVNPELDIKLAILEQYPSIIFTPKMTEAIRKGELTARNFLDVDDFHDESSDKAEKLADQILKELEENESYETQLQQNKYIQPMSKKIRA